VLHPRYRQTCRICGSDKLTLVIDLHDQYLQGSFVKQDILSPPRRKLPTRLVRCDVTQNEKGCGLLQLAHTFPPEILYANYWYRSGTTVTMRNHLQGIVDSAMALFGAEKPTVLDIGCNDGTLLSFYPPSSVKYGVDPSDIAYEVPGDVRVIHTVFPSAQALSVLPTNAFDVVTAIAMFYDLESPVEFATCIAGLMGPRGIWIFEISYLPLMLLQNSFDTICHEHVEYYHFSVLEFIATKADLRIFKAEIDEINGGSIRCYACHATDQSYGTPKDQAFIHRLRIREFEMQLDTDGPYVEFQQRIERLRKKLNSILFDIRASGQRVHIYGASTKGNVLLQWYGISRIIVDFAADRNPQKIGAKTLGTDIPIISEEDSRAMRPDFYLVLPWHFKKEFLQRERATIFAGTKMIFPLPEVEIVSAENYDEALRSANSGGAYLLDLLLG